MLNINEHIYNSLAADISAAASGCKSVECTVEFLEGDIEVLLYVKAYVSYITEIGTLDDHCGEIWQRMDEISINKWLIFCFVGGERTGSDFDIKKLEKRLKFKR